MNVGSRRIEAAHVTGALSGLAALVLWRFGGVGTDLAVVFAAGATLLLPRRALVVLIVLTLRDPDVVVSRLAAADLLIVALVARVAVAHPQQFARSWGAKAPLLALMLLGLLTFLTSYHGESATPLLRLVLFLVLGVALPLADPGLTALRVGLTGLIGTELALALLSPTDRLAGVIIDDPAQLGCVALLAISLLPVTGRLSTSGTVTWATCGAAVLWTLTRGVWFAAALTLIGTRFLRRAPLLGVAAVPVAALGGLSVAAQLTAQLGLNPDSATARVTAISSGLDDFLSHPVLGQGWGYDLRSLQLASGQVVAAPYNLFVYVAAAGGVLALVLLVLFIGSLAMRLAADRRSFCCLLLFLGLSMSEMPLYPRSFTALLGLAVLPALYLEVRATASPERSADDHRSIDSRVAG